MKKESLQEFAHRELTRRQRENGPMLTRWKWFWSPILLLLLLVLSLSLPEAAAAGIPGRNERIAVVVSLAAAMPLFAFFPLLPLYVFAHEVTHWLAAKCFFKKTGRLTLKGASGALEVPCTNWVIVLAPYCFPFYFFMVAGLAAFAGLFLTQPPEWFEIGAAAIATLCYGYHLILTCKALRRGQEDVRYCGTFFASLAILTGNLFFLYLSLVVAGGLWQQSVTIPAGKIVSATTGLQQWLEMLLH